MGENKKLEFYVSFSTLTKITIFLVGIWLLVELKSVLAMLFMAYILTAAISPIIYKLKARKVPIVVSVFIVYFSAFVLVSVLITIIAGPLVDQSILLIKSIPGIINNISSRFPALASYAGFTDWAQTSESVSNVFVSGLNGLLTSFGEIVKFTFSIFGALLGFVLVAVLSFYMLENNSGIRKGLIRLLPDSNRSMYEKLINAIDTNLGAWFRGQLMLCLIIGTLSFIGLQIFGIEFALPLAILAGLLEAVPMVGPIITSIVVFLVALGLRESWPQVIGVSIWFIMQQQLENYLILPKVMQRSVGLHPLFSVIAILIGSELMGIIGAIIAIPVAAVLSISISFFINYKKETSPPK